MHVIYSRAHDTCLPYGYENTCCQSICLGCHISMKATRNDYLSDVMHGACLLLHYIFFSFAEKEGLEKSAWGVYTDNPIRKKSAGDGSQRRELGGPPPTPSLNEFRLCTLSALWQEVQLECCRETHSRLPETQNQSSAHSGQEKTILVCLFLQARLHMNLPWFQCKKLQCKYHWQLSSDPSDYLFEWFFYSS